MEQLKLLEMPQDREFPPRGKSQRPSIKKQRKRLREIVRENSEFVSKFSENYLK